MSTAVARADRPPRRIARELAAGFGMVSLVALAMCALLLGLIDQVSGLVTGMQREESAIREGLELATAVREQYIHIARLLIEDEKRHLEHYNVWHRRLQAGLERLSPHVPPEEHWRLVALSNSIQTLDRYLQSLSVTERPSTIADSREIARLADAAATHADALARVVESRMAHSHVLATRATRLGLVGGGVAAVVIVALSVAFTIRIRGAVLRPLAALTGAARRFGAGEFGTRVGAVGRGELLSLSQAFDRMAEELAERERRLVHNERMAAIGQLAAGVAHELNNPIGIIRGYLKTMSVSEDPETLEQELRILDEEAAHCQRIAEDLLAYARPSELRMWPLRMQAFLEETVKRFGETLQARVEVRAQDAELVADATRLRQVVLNLVHNAVQASPEGATVTVTGRVDGAAYEIAVADSGPGIPQDDQGHVFEPFFTRRQGGSGLGLSVCLGIVRAHGGTVAVESQPGAGAVFRVRLPVYPPQSGSPEGGHA